MQHLIGDMRQAIGEEICTRIESVVDQFHHKDSYYILVYTNKDYDYDTVMRTKIMVMDHRPPEMIGTMCFYINNKTGQATRLWVLPLDRPWDFEGDVVDDLGPYAKNVPILNH